MWFFSRPVCVMGRETSQLSLPINTSNNRLPPSDSHPLQQSAQKRVRGKNTHDSFLFYRAALILLFRSTAAHALCLKDENISHKIDCHKVLIGFI